MQLEGERTTYKSLKPSASILSTCRKWETVRTKSHLEFYLHIENSKESTKGHP